MGKEDPTEGAVLDRVEEVGIGPQDRHPSDQGPDLPAEFPSVSRHRPHLPSGVLHTDRPVAPLHGMEHRQKIRRHPLPELGTDLPALGVDGSAGTHDGADPSLQSPEEKFVAAVEGLSPGAGDGVLSRHAAHGGVSEGSDKCPQAPPLQEDACIGEDHHVVACGPHALVQGVSLSGPLLELDEAHPGIGFLVTGGDGHGPVRGAIGDHQDLHPVHRIVQGEEIVQATRKLAFLVVHR